MNPILDDLGNPRFNHKSIRETIYADNLDVVHDVEFDGNEDINKFVTHAEELGIDMPKFYEDLGLSESRFDWIMSNAWLMPKFYMDLDIWEYVMKRADGRTKKEYSRASKELNEFQARGLLDMLRYMVYLVDVMRQNNIVWGVGRGSSVASYVLYLIGIHRINPLDYDLNWREFLR
jgi:DNA polymerase III alpha subunit